MAFKPELSWEFLSADEIEAKSIRAMRNHVRHVKEVSAYYRDVLADVSPENIKSASDILTLPFTEKKVLVERAASFRAVPNGKIVETVATSGSTGIPFSFPLTAGDLERLEFNEALSFYSAGVTSADRVHLCVHFDRLSLAGIAYYRGLTHLGVNTARIGTLSADNYKYSLDLLKPTVLVGTPSYLKRLANDLAKLGFDKSKSSVRKLFCVGECVRTQELQLNTLGKTLEDLFQASVFSSYGNTELSSSFSECDARCGGHGHPELLYAEIVDEKGSPVPDGTPGELVATPLGVEGNPLVRYKTGDLTFKVPGKCSCGRNSMRIGPILGRISQAVKLKDGIIYPTSIATIFGSADGVEDYLIMLEKDDTSGDRISLHVITPPSNMNAISRRIRDELHVALPLLISNVATIRHLRGKEGRETKILDNRKQGTKPGVRVRQ